MYIVLHVQLIVQLQIMATKEETNTTFPSKDIFANEFHFPAFRRLGVDNDLNLEYWHEDSSGTFTQACTWCFLAEITNDEASQIPFLRNRVFVRDRKGQDNIPISFYPERGLFDFSTLKKGHTICVMLAEQHYFMDMTVGLRIESLDTVKVIPCGLSDLLALSKSYSQRSDSCWRCGKKEREGSLKKCGACKVARYCDKDCQAKDWKDGHRKLCKAMAEFLKMARIDYSKYDEHALFGMFQRIW